MSEENKIKSNKILIKMIKQSIDPIKDQIIVAYRDEFAPDENSCVKAAWNNGSLSEILDMASCLLFEWSGDPDYEDCERDFY